MTAFGFSFFGPSHADKVRTLREWFAAQDDWRVAWARVMSAEETYGLTAAIRDVKRELTRLAAEFRRGNEIVDESIQRAISAGKWPPGAPETVHELTGDEARQLSGLGALPALVIIGIIATFLVTVAVFFGIWRALQPSIIVATAKAKAYAEAAGRAEPVEVLKVQKSMTIAESIASTAGGLFGIIAAGFVLSMFLKSGSSSRSPRHEW